MKKKLAFVLDHKLHHYRAPLFAALGAFYEVTVFHRGPFVEHCEFRQEILGYKKIGPFEYIASFPHFLGFDAVVVMQNLRLLNLYMLPLCFRKKPILLWGIGTSSAKGLDSESLLSVCFRNAVTSIYNGLALYSSIPLGKYWKINQRKIQVVGNSVLNVQAVDTSSATKNYALFIGTLNKRKGLSELISSFARALEVCPDLRLKVIGDGPEKLNLLEQANRLGVANKVGFLGAINDPIEKRKIFKHAFCVVSPFQAGLSVVESFSYGVPFVTSANAITGGESQSIIHEENGVFFRDVSELPDILCSFVDGRRYSAVLGNNAYQYYQSRLSFELYVENFKRFLDQYL